MDYKGKELEGGEQSFVLWLEFEHTEPWEEVDNGFANISVNMMDGRVYGINIWTFKYLDTAMRQDAEVGHVIYIIPPDLFVKELTRTCIEQTIIGLLDQGPLDEILNQSVFNLKFLDPYFDAIEMEEAMINALINELKLELTPDHLLAEERFELIAKMNNNDDIILKLEDGKNAVVHLTWTSKPEIGDYPLTRLYLNEIDFWKREMKREILDFKRK